MEKRNDRLISTYYCHEIFGRYNLYLYRFIKKEKIFASNYCEKYSEEFSNECTYMIRTNHLHEINQHNHDFWMEFLKILK